MLRAATPRGIPRTVLLARRNQAINRSVEPLILPWLYPTQPSVSSRRTVTSSSTPPPTIPVPPRSTAAPQRYDRGERQYNTAAATEAGGEIPFIYGTDHPMDAEASQEMKDDFPFRKFDPSSVIIFDPPAVTSLTNSRAVRNGHIDALEANFHACVRVGRLARAQVLLLQMQKDPSATHNQLLCAHNTFLKALITRLSQQAVTDMELVFKWYETKMKAADFEGDAQTFALLLKSCVQMSDEEDAAEMATQIVQEWKNRGLPIEAVLESSELTNNEVVRISQMADNLVELKPPTLEKEVEFAPQEKSTVLEGRSLFNRALPDIATTEVKGFSLATLKQSVAALLEASSQGGALAEWNREDPAFAAERQRALERDAYDAAADRWQKESEALAKRGVVSLGGDLNAYMWEWQQTLTQEIKKELKKCQMAEQGALTVEDRERLLYGPFLSLVSPEKMATITLMEVMKLQKNMGIADGLRSTSAIIQVGSAIMEEYQANLLMNLNQNEENQFQKAQRKKLLEESFRNTRDFQREVRKIRDRHGAVAAEYGGLQSWPQYYKAKVGGCLLHLMIENAMIPVSTPNPTTGEEITTNQPAFHYTNTYVRGKRQGIIRLHPMLLEKLGTGEIKAGIVNPKLLPMVAKPIPWESTNKGGYYFSTTRIMRIKQSDEQKNYLRAAAERGDLDGIYAGLNVLGETPWRVNPGVFDVLVQVWNSGAPLAEIPPAKLDVHVPPAPPKSAEPIAKAKWIQAYKDALIKKNNAHSTRCDINLKMEIARAFLNEKFYFPHNVDFRGRAYPIPPNFNHMGNDMCRGLLMFAEGKPLGEKGLRWLKIQLANVYGFDKASLDEREQFANEHMDDIKDSAKNALSGARWWLDGEEPWQVLAACIALKEAHELPDPTKYICHLYVAQDGSCNGLQHYAALGGDADGAKAVNLEPSDRPQDVYKQVCDAVNAYIDQEAEEGVEAAKRLKGLVSRKVVKQTVMTNVYGVTFIGARAQILNRLKELEELSDLDAPALNKLALYLTHKTFQGIRTMFFGASEIQNWLTEAAWRIAKSVSPVQIRQYGENPESDNKFMTTTIWTTPMGLPVVQPYRNRKLTSIATNLQKCTIVDPYAVETINARKQSSAFPPNYIHSLDASHMIMTALKSKERGIAFAAVHDSFWTHPCDVDTMNELIRESFIELHKGNLVENLRDEFVTRYDGYYSLLQIPGNSALSVRIRKIRFGQMSKTSKSRLPPLVKELKDEITRQEMLASDDPEKVEQAKKMITPTRLFLESRAAMEAYKNKLSNDAFAALDGKADDAVLAMEDEGADAETAAPEAEIPVKKPRKKRITKKEKEAAAAAAAAKEKAEAEGVEVEGATEINGEGEEVSAEEAELEPVEPTSARKAQQTQLWVPLMFPPIPPKGDYDVSRVRGSPYFFS